jgi:hypothetical protein
MTGLVLFRLINGDPSVRHDDPEPALGELLADPITKLLMRSDGVRPAELLRAIDCARARLRLPRAAPRAQAQTQTQALCAECQA